MASIKDKILNVFIPVCGYCGEDLREEGSYQFARNALTAHHKNCEAFRTRPIKGKQHRDNLPRSKNGYLLIDITCPLCQKERRVTDASFYKSIRKHPNNPELIGICNYCQMSKMKPAIKKQLRGEGK